MDTFGILGFVFGVMGFTFGMATLGQITALKKQIDQIASEVRTVREGRPPHA